MISMQQSRSGSSQSHRSPSTQPFLSVSITDPIKLGNSVQAHIPYHIITKTNYLSTKVKRRLLFDVTMILFVHVTLSVRSTKAFCFSSIFQRRVLREVHFSAEFIKMRHQALDIFVNKIALHHELQQSEDLRTLLQVDEETMESKALEEIMNILTFVAILK
ncbi:hypothetical protein AAG906_007571 [Vitis piasezkii]